MSEKIRMFTTVDDIYKALDDKVPITQKFVYSHPTKTDGKSIRLSIGRIWFNLLLPSEFPLYDEPITTKVFSEIVKKIKNGYSAEESSDYISKLTQETLKLSSYIPTSFSIDSLILSDDVKEIKSSIKEKNIKDPTEFEKHVKNATNKIVNQLSEDNERVDNIRISGAKDIPWDKLMVAQGYVSDIEGNILGPINSALSDGNNPKDYYKGAAEARLGFYYKAAVSAKPGYLARRVTMANASIQIDDSIKDCGTKKYFKLTVDKNIADIIGERYMIVNGKPKLIENSNDLIGSTINLRSPLYCHSEKGICPICYGRSWEHLGNKNIGILAGGDINNKALNAYMKMRHSSSIPKIVQVNFINDLIKYNMYTPEFKKNFIVETNKIVANNECFISIDFGDYDERLLVESVDYYLIPGILTITLTDDNTKTWTFPFDYRVKLIKPAEIQTRGKIVLFNYTPGESIIEQDAYQEITDVSVLERLLEGQAKYITNPEILTIALTNYLGGMDLNIIEVVVQNMFRDTSNPMKPARLNDYTSFQIYGQKKLPFVTSWVNALAFENVKKSIQYGLVSGQNAENDPITKIVNEDY